MNLSPYPQSQGYGASQAPAYQPPAYQAPAQQSTFNPEYVRYVKYAANIIDYYAGNWDGSIDAREAQTAKDYFTMIGDFNFANVFDSMISRLANRSQDQFFNDGLISYYATTGTDEMQQIADLRGDAGDNAVFSSTDLYVSQFYYAQPQYTYNPYNPYAAYQQPTYQQPAYQQQPYAQQVV